MKEHEHVRKLVIASSNAGKVAEFRSLFAPLGWTVTSLRDMPDAPHIVESGHTFMENACIKAWTTADYYGLPALADDSGLCVEALDDRPGVYSARYAGGDADDAANNDKLMQELREKGMEWLEPADPRRRARFVCALVLAIPNGAEVRAEGECPGFILSKPRGENGFGYDPLFYLPEYDKTMAELSEEEKNRISHRARALEKLRSVLQA